MTTHLNQVGIVVNVGNASYIEVYLYIYIENINKLYTITIFYY